MPRGVNERVFPATFDINEGSNGRDTVGKILWGSLTNILSSAAASRELCHYPEDFLSLASFNFMYVQ